MDESNRQVPPGSDDDAIIVDQATRALCDVPVPQGPSVELHALTLQRLADAASVPHSADQESQKRSRIMPPFLKIAALLVIALSGAALVAWLTRPHAPAPQGHA